MKPLKHELEKEYLIPGITISCLAKKYNTHRPTIRQWLIEYNIPRKSHKQASTEANNRHRNSTMPSKEELKINYKTMSIKDLEEHYSVSQATIYMWLNNHNIDILSQKERIGQFITKYWPDKTKVEEIYENVKNIQLLANELGCSYSKAKETLYHYDIERYQKIRVSTGQNELFEWLCSIDCDGEWKMNDRSLIYPQEIDIISYKRKIAIEYCGIYWHSETWGNKSKHYHLNKLNSVLKEGFNLYTIFDYVSPEKIKLFLKKKLFVNNNSIAGRETIFSEITYKDIKEFEETYHLGGSRSGEKYFVLKDKNDCIVQSMSFGKSRFNKKYEWEMIRFTSGDTNVVGGASKLFTNALKIIKPQSLITYCDRRYGEGKTYLSLGMILDNPTEPNYWYFHKNNPFLVFSRVKFQKHKLPSLLEKFDISLSEYENMLQNKYDRFWDCGNNVYKYNCGSL